jgi:ABC transport system ATP-binding/permease protein
MDQQTIVNQLIKLTAIYLGTIRGNAIHAITDSFFEYFRAHFPVVNRRMFDEALNNFSSHTLKPDGPVELPAEEVLSDIGENLDFKDQLQLILMMLDLSNLFDGFGNILQPERRAESLGIPADDFNRYKTFITTQDPDAEEMNDFLVFSSHPPDQTEKLEGRWIENRIQDQQDDENYLDIDNFRGKLLVMFLKPIQSFLVRCIGDDRVEVDGSRLSKCKFKIIGAGSFVEFNSIPILSFSDIKQRYIRQKAKRSISLTVNNLQVKDSRSASGIHSLTVEEHSGSLVGILGKEGSGKTTLLKLLAGYIMPDAGQIEINGYELKKNRYLLKDIIGYVPEEDLLFEELSVYDNLLMNARLYYSGLTGRQIGEKVDNLLKSLWMNDIRDKIVGNVLNKNIQPGQRRILNIALEILREPQILLVDNALSGLSMSDTAKVVKVLHNYTLEGNLVITTISQVSSNIFNHFDKIWLLDLGGYPVYTGSSAKAVNYLFRKLNLSDKCPEAIDTATLIDLVNYSKVQHEDAAITRILSPLEWHQLYLNSRRAGIQELQRKSVFPIRPIHIPNLEVQFIIFSLRNFLCKFSRINNLIYTLLSGPLIALLLGFFLRPPGSHSAFFSTNSNLPAYQFISVLVAMFMGMVISAREILKEKNIVQKEQFLEFSRFSYINSKIIFLLLIVALQSFLYTIIGNAILGIKGMIWSYWIVLFSVACFGVLTGLLFSSVVSRLSIIDEKLIPIFLALQVLFGGGVISYHALNLEKTKFVPVIGELMVSRWGYEALAVHQFSGNPYQKNFFEADKNISRSNYYASYLLPELSKLVDKSLKLNEGNDTIGKLTRIIYNELRSITLEPEMFPFEYLDSLRKPQISQKLLLETRDYLTYLKLRFYDLHESSLMHKSQLTRHLIDSLGQDGFNRLKHLCYNRKLEEVVTNSNYGQQIELIGDRFVRFKDGIYQSPDSNYGRAVMFTPSKIFNNQEMYTLWFNVSVIWMFSSIIYLLLLTDAINYIRKNLSV